MPYIVCSCVHYLSLHSQPGEFLSFKKFRVNHFQLLCLFCGLLVSYPHCLCNFLSQDMKNTSNNRGFAFVDYYNHACADYSRQKMVDPKFKLDNNAPTVSWADPKNAESSAASQVAK